METVTKVYSVFEVDSKNPSIPASVVHESFGTSMGATRYARRMNARAAAVGSRYNYVVERWVTKS